MVLRKRSINKHGFEEDSQFAGVSQAGSTRAGRCICQPAESCQLAAFKRTMASVNVLVIVSTNEQGPTGSPSALIYNEPRHRMQFVYLLDPICVGQFKSNDARSSQGPLQKQFPPPNLDITYLKLSKLCNIPRKPYEIVPTFLSTSISKNHE